MSNTILKTLRHSTIILYVSDIVHWQNVFKDYVDKTSRVYYKYDFEQKKKNKNFFF